MASACPDIPLVVLPADNVVHCRTRPTAPVAAALTAAIDALTHLRAQLQDPNGAGDSVKEAMDAAVARSGELAAEAAVPTMDTAPLVPIVPNHEYFGVRTADIDDAYRVSEITTVIARTLVDLRGARLDLNDQASEVRAMILILRGLDPQEGPFAEARPAGEALLRVGADELSRWVVTHHFYFVLNLAAAAAVSRAVAALADADRDAATAAFQEAAVLVRGFTAAMIHSGDMSAACYDAKVRPTMAPPAVPAALTGRTQPEHKAFRKAIRKLVAASPEPFAKLAATGPELAVARDSVLDADLLDIERHIVITAALVGDDSSIIQGDESAESAIAILRTMRHTRAMAYYGLMRFGDNVEIAGA
ncbi:hypothetical protein [Kitasatospora sp. CB01950]|uniref:hypothetical protein n=1 Tax=Kitasatospora sp. CB01950 TaxID=1703930 RepID=UPI00093952FE|nr:hypothetical protein [Kitasatospora sp. CB01950]OKJ11684.1 hypothetical protein AMK19_12510 [Kitasatospora sp. CB01950]